MSNALSAKEICAIIQTCAKSKVTSLSLGDLQVSFEPIDKPVDSWPQYELPTAQEIATANSEEQPNSNFHKQVTADVLNDLALTDPLAFEKFMTGEDKIDDID